ncbi:MAG: metallophosphoesterase [Candidatus Sumerlaeaceae bacterium]|nr:metallophosphoesterase [Candidatus Sumerlaeaceae bacterium]
MNTPLTRIIHCSDIHFGHGHRPECSAALLSRVRELNPDAVIVSGDLTMRARGGQFARAEEWLKQLPTPVMVIPGNHDIPLYNLALRLTNPFRNYRRFAEPHSTNPIELPCLRAIGINTINPHRHQQGIIDGVTRDRVCEWLTAQPQDAWRLVVIHQHVKDIPGHHRPGAIPGARETLEAWARAGAHAVLHGHIHFDYAQTADQLFPGFPVPMLVIAAGTGSNARTRGKAGTTNSFHLVEFSQEKLEISTQRWNSMSGRFEADQPVVFPRSLFSN